MKKLLVCMAMLCCALSVSAQEEVKSYSVYDVNHDSQITVEDITKVVKRAGEENADEDPQVVDAQQVNSTLQTIYTQMVKLEELSNMKTMLEAKIQDMNVSLLAMKTDLQTNLADLEQQIETGKMGSEQM